MADAGIRPRAIPSLLTAPTNHANTESHPWRYRAPLDSWRKVAEMKATEIPSSTSIPKSPKRAKMRIKVERGDSVAPA